MKILSLKSSDKKKKERTKKFMSPLSIGPGPPAPQRVVTPALLTSESGAFRVVRVIFGNPKRVTSLYFLAFSGEMFLSF